jgi:hypothetical protein
LLALFLPGILLVIPLIATAGENSFHTLSKLTGQVRTFARGSFLLAVENTGPFVSTNGTGLRWYGEHLITGAGLMLVGKDSLGVLHSSLGGP